ncbi:zinc finger protein ZIC 5-like [Meles meles]|uniref:zinc finger protein ZIC 5-like n=1 Tax=Meles meles TaxID=9662 RepID=UPI001E69F10D|nr:zinc finger protein ZIC 5-like [Meles meles]XP_045852922.1 zinc finger protein ZIC 5-like [Meles meles]XP_045866413.1 zinc finger protein ZIC 5-like [Meles meles]
MRWGGDSTPPTPSARFASVRTGMRSERRGSGGATANRGAPARSFAPSASSTPPPPPRAPGAGRAGGRTGRGAAGGGGAARPAVSSPGADAGLWLSGTTDPARRLPGFPGVESAPECRRPPGLGSRFLLGCVSGGGCCPRAEVHGDFFLLLTTLGVSGRQRESGCFLLMGPNGGSPGLAWQQTSRTKAPSIL